MLDLSLFTRHTGSSRSAAKGKAAAPAKGETKVKAPKPGKSISTKSTNKEFLDLVKARQSFAQYTASGIRITLPGKPISLQRHKIGAAGQVYNPSRKDITEQQLVLAKVFPGNYRLPLFPQHSPKTGDPLRVSMNICYFVPPTTGRVPDLDNLVKFTLEVGTSVFYHDDVQVGKIEAARHENAKEPRTVILCKKMEQE